MKSFLLSFAFIIVASLSCFSQDSDNLNSKSPKAIKHFKDGLSFYEYSHSNEAKAELLEAIKIDPEFTDAHNLLGGVYTDLNQKDEAIAEYKRSIEIDPVNFPKIYFSLAKVEKAIGRYADAKAHFEKFLSFPRMNATLSNQARHAVEQCDFSIIAVKNAVSFKPNNLGDGVNTRYQEYLPSLTIDDQTLIFTRRTPVDLSVEKYYPKDNDGEDFYVSNKTKTGEWGKSFNLGPPINTDDREGAQCISPDGKFLFFTGCERSDGFGKCDLYMSEKVGDKWGIPVNLGEGVNSTSWDAQPSFSSDGKTLYFVSTRAGGFGKSDIWKTIRNEDGSWTTPVNLGNKINTSEKETAPFIHSDDQTLYFASEGRLGLGGSDIYYARKTPLGEWNTPVNIGYPINTFADENTLIVSNSGQTAFFASDREGGKGSFDIYSFDLYKEAQPLSVSYLKGKVYDAISNNIISAKFELIDLSNSKVIVESASDKQNGNFLVALPLGKDYALNVSKSGYMFYSDNFSLKSTGGTPAKPVLMDVPLHPIKAGQSVVLKNIFFETNAFALKGESGAFLTSNPTVRIEISGHTDNSGDKKYNEGLSEKRAKAVYDKLVEMGVVAGRLTFKGYGDSKPIAPNTTEEGKAKNRRTEFTIL
jgi:tetratricopeptide (TPR) repeat protein